MKGVMIISGTRKGIGRAMAAHYLELGWRVVGCSRRPSDLLHPGYRHFTLDVTEETAMTEMVRTVTREEGSIDAVLNNAGIAAMNHLLLTPLATARSVLNTNFMGTFLLAREAAKVMVRQKRGRIVNFTSVAVALDLEGEAVYAASKAAVEALTRVAARELGAFGITVNAIGPTPIRTDLIRKVPQEKIDALIARQALRRVGEMQDVFNVVDFFLSEASSFVTGQVIYLGGVAR